MIDDGANPLSEVALALAMAFFSLMVLTLFAVVHQPETAIVDSMVLQKSADEVSSEPPKLVLLHTNGLFDEMLRPINADDLPAGKSITLGVQADVTMSEMMRFKQAHPSLDLKISELTSEWTDLLNAKLGGSDE